MDEQTPTELPHRMAASPPQLPPDVGSWKTLLTDPTAVWFFTFGVGHAYGRRYVRIVGTYDDARAEMINRHGLNWCAQLAEFQREEAIDRYNLTELTP